MDRYEIKVSEVRSIDDRDLGKFTVSFVVEPPINFSSEEARTELAEHLLTSVNILGNHHLISAKKGAEMSGTLVSFTHNTADNSGTMGSISGYGEEEISQELVHRALDSVLNPPQP